MLLVDDAASEVHEAPVVRVELVELRHQDARVDEHPGPDAETCVGVDETRRHHPDAVLPVTDLDRVPGVRADARPAR